MRRDDRPILRYLTLTFEVQADPFLVTGGHGFGAIVLITGDYIGDVVGPTLPELQLNSSPWPEA